MVDVIQEIKRNLSIRSILQENGVPIRGNQFASFINKTSDNPNDAEIYNEGTENEHFYDFKAGFTGDVIDLIRYFNFNANIFNKKDHFKEALELARKKANISAPIKIKALMESNKYLDNLHKYSKNLFDGKTNSKEALEYLINRGYPVKYIKVKNIGYNPEYNCISFPLDSYYNYTLIQYRSIANNDKNNRFFRDASLKKDSDPTTIAYNLKSPEITSENKPIFIVEGIVDSDNIIWNKTGAAIATVGGGINSSLEKLIIPALKQYRNREIILLFDNDRTGKEYYLKASLMFLEAGINDFNVCIVPKKDGASLSELYDQHFKTDNKIDINDYYLSHDKSLKGILDTKINGLTYLSLCFKRMNEEDLKAVINRSSFKDSNKSFPTFLEILNSVSRFIPNDYLNEFLSSELFNSSYNDLEKEEINNIIKRPPNDITVVEYITKKYNLLYCNSFEGKTGFMKFNKIWKTLDIGELNHIITNAIGRKYVKGNRIPAIINVLKGECRIKEPFSKSFNQKDKIAFENGTLDLKTGVFYNFFNPNDQLSNIVNYDYDPNATCPTWEKAIKDMLEVKNDPIETKNKIRLLQQFLGYILIPDYLHKKALVLKGDHDNGKSVITDTLIKIFPVNSGVSIDVSNLGNQFTEILLKDAYFNLASETKGELISSNGAGIEFKKVTSGDPLTDSYKGKDKLTFISRAKHIISANNDIRTDDRSGAIKDRLLFIEFPYIFVNNPNRPNEKLRNINLRKELEKEKAGIFNWIYKGRLDLLEQGNFIETKDNLLQLDNFELNNNKFIEFVLELNEDLYRCQQGYTNSTVFTSGIWMYINEFLSGENKFIPAKEIYGAFKEFCDFSGVASVGRNSFYREFNRALKILNVNFEVTDKYNNHVKSYYLDLPKSELVEKSINNINS